MNGAMRELAYQYLLAEKLSGSVEVETPVGRIDILSAEWIVEVKEFKAWKSALGQVLAYSTLVAERKAAIAVYGRGIDPAKMNLCVQTCSQFSVSVWELNATLAVKDVTKVAIQAGELAASVRKVTQAEPLVLPADPNLTDDIVLSPDYEVNPETLSEFKALRDMGMNKKQICYALYKARAGNSHRWKLASAVYDKMLVSLGSPCQVVTESDPED
jgi:hypothetical protein